MSPVLPTIKNIEAFLVTQRADKKAARETQEGELRQAAQIFLAEASADATMRTHLRDFFGGNFVTPQINEALKRALDLDAPFRSEIDLLAGARAMSKASSELQSRIAKGGLTLEILATALAVICREDLGYSISIDGFTAIAAMTVVEAPPAPSAPLPSLALSEGAQRSILLLMEDLERKVQLLEDAEEKARAAHELATEANQALAQREADCSNREGEVTKKGRALKAGTTKLKKAREKFQREKEAHADQQSRGGSGSGEENGVKGNPARS